VPGHLPPDHLLRNVFETCKTFREARQRLETTPVARPVIYTLVGCERGERCVIERTEEAYASRDDDTAAANDWLHAREPWEARMPSGVVLTRSYEEAAERSRARASSSAVGQVRWRATISAGNAAGAQRVHPAGGRDVPREGVLRARGYENTAGAELPAPATLTCEVAAAVA